MFFPYMNESIPVFVAPLYLEKSLFLQIAHFQHGAIDGTIPPPPHLTHTDEIITFIYI